MAHATCVLCGASNPLTRVYAAMGSPRPNLVPIACSACGKVSSQLRSLGEYLAFGAVYAAIATVLMITGIALFEERWDTWIAVVAGAMPFAFLPGWWAARQAASLAARAPTEDLSVGQKLLYLLATLVEIAAILGGALLAYLLLRR